MKTSLTILIVILSATLSVNAQGKINRILTMTVQTARQDTSNFLTSADSAVFSARIKIFLMDTTGISQFTVTLKASKDTSSSLLEHNFDFDTNPGGNFTYTRKKHMVDIGLGNYMGLSHLYAEVKIRRTDGSYTEPVTFKK